jgi:hypothetical protein
MMPDKKLFWLGGLLRKQQEGILSRRKTVQVSVKRQGRSDKT